MTKQARIRLRHLVGFKRSEREIFYEMMQVVTGIKEIGLTALMMIDTVHVSDGSSCE